MITTSNISDGSKIIGQAVSAQYDLNPIQVILAVGSNLELDEKAPIDGGGVVEWTYIGRLESTPFMVETMLTNSMVRDAWDFETYPNPLVFVGDILEEGATSI